MAFLEWRKFNFFDVIARVDEGKLSAHFQDTEITVTTSGNNHLVFGDSNGQLHIISRSWQLISSFKAYDIRLLLAQQMRNSPVLVTVGEDEMGLNPLIKVWDTGRLDKSGAPYCTRVSRAATNNRGTQVSTMCVHENMQLMAVGYMDGSLILYRGDVTRERGSRQKVLREASSAITGLAFKSSGHSVLLFVATDNSVYVYNITHKDREVMSRLDAIGCAKHCTVLAESLQESHFMVGRNDAVYCYTSDGRGPCYAIEGEKLMLQWFRSYLIIVSKSSRLTPTTQTAPTGGANQSGQHLITLLDIQNKFIVFSAPLDDVKAVLNEWGGFYILDHKNNIYHLNEKDLQSKLLLLFKKNLYDIAIRIAKSQQYDTDGLVDLFRQYGDHLYGKGDHSGAIEQYVKTIGKLEPSYVIRRFMDSKHIDKLTSYLQALHKQGQASEDHTTLLLNCFTKLNRNDQLKEFILQKDKDLDFDVDIAIKVCRQGSPEEALMLAKKHRKHDWYIKLQLEDHQRYSNIIDYLSDLYFQGAEHYMKKYGKVLIENAPHESTEFLKKLCTDYKPAKQPIVSENMLNGGVEESEKADPEDFIHLFLNNSTQLVEFLDYLIQQGCILSSPVYDTLLEHYLHVWETFDDGAEKNRYEQKALKLLQNTDIKYDKPQALVVCHMHGFSEGILYLYEEQKLYQQILRYHMSRKDTNMVLACCKRFGHQDRSLWVQALWSCVRDPENTFQDLLPEVLNVIAKERLLSPQLVIEAIGTGKAEIKLSHIRSYVLNELKKEQDGTINDRDLKTKYYKDTQALKEKLETLKNGPILIQGSRCAACHHPLQIPSLHFLCQHSYHQHCFQSYSENENECLACQPENKKLLELLKAREYNKDLRDETFHSQLEKVSDGFALAAEYFGRGVFNTVKIVTDKPTERRPSKSEMALSNSSHLMVESRIRQEENKRASPIVPISEGRIRLQENNFSSSLEANITFPKNIEKKRSEEGLNPFDEYDEALNPFSGKESDAKAGADAANEKGEEGDDYDKNFNPFFSS